MKSFESLLKRKARDRTAPPNKNVPLVNRGTKETKHDEELSSLKNKADGG